VVCWACNARGLVVSTEEVVDWYRGPCSSVQHEDWSTMFRCIVITVAGAGSVTFFGMDSVDGDWMSILCLDGICVESVEEMRCISKEWSLGDEFFIGICDFLIMSGKESGGFQSIGILICSSCRVLVRVVCSISGSSSGSHVR